MPTYSYACTACSHAFDIYQSFSEDSLTTCPECSGRLRKVFNSVGVVFKGSGFYRTDSRNEASGGSAAAGSSPGKSASAGTGASAASGSSAAGSSTSGSSASASSAAPAAGAAKSAN